MNIKYAIQLLLLLSLLVACESEYDKLIRKGVETNNPEIAIKYYSDAIKLNPNNSDAYFFRGMEYTFDNLSPQKSNNDFLKAIKLGRSANGLYTVIAINYEYLKDYSKALEFLNKKIEVDSNNFYAFDYYQKARLEVKLNMINDAIIDYKIVVNMMSSGDIVPFANETSVHDNMVFCYLLNEQEDSSLHYLEIILKDDNNYYDQYETRLEKEKLALYSSFFNNKSVIELFNKYK